MPGPAIATIATVLTCLVGYGFALLVPQNPLFGIRKLGDKLWISVGGRLRDRDANLPQILGTLELVMYPTAYLLGQPEFIGIWLALKVAGNWRGWEHGHKGVHGRRLVQIFLIGAGLCVTYGVTGALLVKALLAGNVALAIAAPVGATVLNIGLYVAARHSAARYDAERKTSKAEIERRMQQLLDELDELEQLWRRKKIDLR